MPILQPGSFSVADYRKDIDAATKKAVLKRYQFDHRPPLQDRPYDTDAGDFIPPQLDPVYIEAIDKQLHLFRTTGRAPGAEQTVTTKGSDSHNRKHRRHVADSEALHQAALARKAGDAGAEREAASRVTQRSRLKPKPRIPSRKLRSGNSFQQRRK
jgi:hypothetical protein